MTKLFYQAYKKSDILSRSPFPIPYIIPLFASELLASYISEIVFFSKCHVIFFARVKSPPLRYGWQSKVSTTIITRSSGFIWIFLMLRRVWVLGYFTLSLFIVDAFYLPVPYLTPTLILMPKPFFCLLLL